MDSQNPKTADTAKAHGRPDPPPPPTEKGEGTLPEAAATYFFHPVQLADLNSGNLDEEEIEKTSVEVEQQFQDNLKSISEETLQLSEFLLEENKLIRELCEYLRQVLAKLNVAFNIPPETVSSNAELQKVVLNEKGHLILVYEDEYVGSAFLAEYPPDVVMTVLRAITPELAKVMSLYRKKINTRVNFFGRMRKELRGVAHAMQGAGQEQEASHEESLLDVAKGALQNEETNQP
jgi:hypothetical protein